MWRLCRLSTVQKQLTTAAHAAAAATVAAAELNKTARMAGLSEALTCPICNDQLSDPVSTPGGITYCKACILAWLDGGHATCPHTRQPLNADQLVPKYVLRQVLEQLQQPLAQSAGSERQAAAAQTCNQATDRIAGQQPAGPVRRTGASGPVSAGAAI